MRRGTSIKLLLNSIVVICGVVSANAAEPLTYTQRFRVDPLTVLGKVTAIQPRNARQQLGTEELRMLQDFRSGNLRNWSTADIALVVAGITDDAEVAQYKQQLDDITAQAQDVIKDETTSEKQTRKLAKFLHDVPMQAGYVSGQYDLKVLLDTGHYNCVSSAVFFDIIARRVGLNVEGVNIPRHVFCRVAGFDVETTSGRVYPSSIRSDRVLKKRKEEDDAKNSLYSDQLFRETNNGGLMSEPYFDEGCKLEKEKKYDQGLISFLKAATLDPKIPETARAINNSMKRWFDDSIRRHQVTRATAIAKLYREILRDPSAATFMDKKLKAAKGRKAA